MSDGNLDSLSSLDDAVLAEVVREAERRLDAQLSIATAADQRAMAWAALLATAAVALTSAAGALLIGGEHRALGGLAVLASLSFAYSIFKAIDVVRPKGWHLPGNSPTNWEPEQWQCHGIGRPCNLRQARIEQAATLDQQIRENARDAEAAGKALQLSMDVALITIVLGAIGVGALTLAAALV